LLIEAKDRRIAKLEQRVAELEALFKAALEKTAKLLKKFGNSSKPPSTDIVKPSKQQDRRRKKKAGGQKGHKQNLRTPFAPEQIDETVELTLEACPKCGGELAPTNENTSASQA